MNEGNISGKSEKNNNNISFFLYTGLIFLIALLIILISCFGQSKATNETLPETVSATSGIEEKAAAVNAENSRLVQENDALKSELESITEENTAVNDELYAVHQAIDCYTLYKNGQLAEAALAAEDIDISKLSETELAVLADLQALFAEQQPQEQ